VAPIASAVRHPADCKARYGGVADTKLSKFQVEDAGILCETKALFDKDKVF
jgi:hypothetical protein